MIDHRLPEAVRSVVVRREGPRAALLNLDAKPLRGGISADGVVAVRAEYHDARRNRRVLSLVAKRLAGGARREVDVFRRLDPHAFPFVPRVLAIEPDGDASLLLLEWIRPSERWPWRRIADAEAVLRAAAELHRAPVACDAEWDYERELAACAAATLDRLDAARRDAELPIDGASRRAVRRAVGALGGIRRELLSGAPFAPTFIHGDLHPGNVVLSARGRGPAPVLLDWGRARVGSPLEDVASWLQTLACWEPEARARHDTLLAAYARARGGGAALGAPLRRAVWLAGASNALAGALLHQLGVATRPDTPRAARAPAVWAVREWLRIIRRADATWSGVEAGATCERSSNATTARRRGPQSTADSDALRGRNELQRAQLTPAADPRI
jgi:hypothetical protein